MVGQTISHYRIVEKLGEGGMGVVYKAEDTKLDRPVALKFLPPHLLGNEEVRKRFEREAKAAAALHHPNICPVYEIDEVEGKAFIAMAYIEGDSLDKKIAQGPLKLDHALDVAQQVARGLEAAHKKGIFHRDIKPENVIVGDEGHITIMDFGLAQLAEASRLTRDDTTLGTAAYMSPEQTEGSGTDHRTDIWSLGVVLYEMLTGQRPFKGDYDKAIMYSILNEEPEPITALRTGVPMELERIVGKCLAKKNEDRYQGIADLMVDLRTLRAREALPTASSMVADPERWGGVLVQQPPTHSTLTIGLAAALTVSLVALLVLLLRPAPRSELPAQVRFAFTPESINTKAVLSPNGKHIAYPSAGDDARIWVRDLDQEVPRPLENTEGATASLFWSPDSRFLGFQANGQLKKVSIEGGPATLLCDVTRYGGYTGGAWSPDGESIVFTLRFDAPLFEVSAQGGQAEAVTVAPRQSGTRRYFGANLPSFLPLKGPDKIVLHGAGTRTDRKIILHNLSTGEEEALVVGSAAVYSTSGHILYQTNPYFGDLYAVPFSLDEQRTTGEPFPVAQNAGHASVSADGSLVYVDLAAPPRQLGWRDREGTKLGGIGRPQRDILGPVLSPDGRYVAARGGDDENSDIWIHETDRPVAQRFTFHPSVESEPVWGPFGSEVAFRSDRNGARELFLKSLDSSAEAAQLLKGDRLYPRDWSSDGRSFIYLIRDNEGQEDIWYLHRTGADDVWESRPFLKSAFNETAASLSPDNHLLAYCSDKTGRQEVYIQPFPQGGRELQVSTDGGCQPRWRGDSRELFFVSGTTLFSAKISDGESYSASTPSTLFHYEGLAAVTPFRPEYDVTRDGQRFVVIETVESDEFPKPAVHYIQNWYEEFRDHEQD